MREFSQISSNWRSAETAQLYLNRHKIPVIWDIDTRALVRHIRNVGALRGIVATDGTPAEQLIFEAKQLPAMAGQELASRVTCGKAYDWDKGSIELAISPWSEQMGESEREPETRKLRVVAYDYGIKQNILRLLVDHHCDVAVVPARNFCRRCSGDSSRTASFFRTGRAIRSPSPTRSKIFESSSGECRFSAFASGTSFADWRWAGKHSN